MKSDTLRMIGLSCAALACMGVSDAANAAVVYNYTGLPFAANQSTAFVGNHITATVTFDDSVAGFTGVVGAAAVLGWAIRVEGVAGTELTDSTGYQIPAFPFYFAFNSGDIQSWQFLARAAPGAPPALWYPEVYTTHNSPFGNILPTADFYVQVGNASGGAVVYGGNVNTPGVWQLVPTSVPEPVIGGFLLGAGWMVCATMARRRRRAA